VRRFSFLLAFGAAILCGPFCSSAAGGAGLALEALVAEALARNPEIRAAREREGALRERIPQAGALEDPMIGFGILNVPRNFELDEEDMTAKELSLSQKLPFPGKLEAAAEAAGYEAQGPPGPRRRRPPTASRRRSRRPSTSSPTSTAPTR